MHSYMSLCNKAAWIWIICSHVIMELCWASQWSLLLHDVVLGGGPRVVVSTAAFHAVRGSVPGLGGLKETKLFLPYPRVKVSIVGSLRDREVACSASCVWRTVSSQSSPHPQEVLLAQLTLYVHKGGLKPDSFHFYDMVLLLLLCKKAFKNRPISYIFTLYLLQDDCLVKININPLKKNCMA